MQSIILCVFPKWRVYQHLVSKPEKQDRLSQLNTEIIIAWNVEIIN